MFASRTLDDCKPLQIGMPDDLVFTGNPSMSVDSEDLEQALRWALAGATFDLGRVDPKYPSGNVTIYAGRPEDTLDPESLRDFYRRERTQNGSSTRGRPMVRVEDGPRRALEEVLRSVLHDYVDPSTESVGHAFPMGGDRGSAITSQNDELRTDARFSSVQQLAGSLIRCAAVTGCDQAARLISDWANGAPMRYRVCIVLPVTLARSISPIPGVDFVPLGLSTEELPAGLPVISGRSRIDYLGQTLVYIAAETTPGSFSACQPAPADELLARIPCAAGHVGVHPPSAVARMRRVRPWGACVG